MKSTLKQRLSTALSAGLALSGLGLTGCVAVVRPRREVVVVEAPPPSGPIVVADAAPPPDQEEYVGAAPYSDAIWIRGHYVWRDGEGRWAWFRGHWDRRPHYGAVWIEGYWR